MTVMLVPFFRLLGLINITVLAPAALNVGQYPVTEDLRCNLTTSKTTRRHEFLREVMLILEDTLTAWLLFLLDDMKGAIASMLRLEHFANWRPPIKGTPVEYPGGIAAGRGRTPLFSDATSSAVISAFHGKRKAQRAFRPLARPILRNRQATYAEKGSSCGSICAENGFCGAVCAWRQVYPEGIPTKSSQAYMDTVEGDWVLSLPPKGYRDHVIDRM